MDYQTWACSPQQIDITDWTSNGKQLFLAECTRIGIRIPRIFKEDTIIKETCISPTRKSELKKLNNKNIYRYNALTFVTIMDRIANNPNPPSTTLKLTIKNMILDSRFLLHEFDVRFNNVQSHMGKNYKRHPFEVYTATMQFLYSYSAGFTFLDSIVDATSVLLRTSIELRIRDGFGIYGAISPTKGLIPINMKAIVQAINSEIDSRTIFSIDLDSVVKIYEWCNMYVHAGIKQYIWSLMFATDYLSKFFTGVPITNGMNINSGIQTDVATVKRVQDKIKSKFKEAGTDFIFTDPGRCEVHYI